jgi:hypothetical protein
VDPAFHILGAGHAAEELHRGADRLDTGGGIFRDGDSG